jgi:hypothetical protein
MSSTSGAIPGWRTSRLRKTLALAIVVAVAVGVVVTQAGGSHNHAAVVHTVVPTKSLSHLDPRVPRRATYADAGCESATCLSGGVPPGLRRSWAPVPVTGQGCPSAAQRVVLPGFGPAGGQGPVYPVMDKLPAEPHLKITVPPPADGRFGGSKFAGRTIFWLVSPDYWGPVLIRGHQLDGGTPVLFSFVNGPLLTDVQLPPVSGYAPHEWREISIYTRLAAPGCYAWQVDGTTFTYSVPFQAESGP